MILFVAFFDKGCVFLFILLFSRVPEAAGEFFAFYFFPFAVWGGGFFRLVWNSGGLGEGGEFPPPVSTSDGGGAVYHESLLLRVASGATHRKHETFSAASSKEPIGKLRQLEKSLNISFIFLYHTCG